MVIYILTGSDFESKYHFRTLHDFPLPIAFMNCIKTYPSKNGKNTKRPETSAPPPPSPSPYHTKPPPPACPQPVPAITLCTPPPTSSTSIPPPPPLPSSTSIPPAPPLSSSFPSPPASSQPPSFAENYNLRRGFQLGQKFPLQNATNQSSDV